MNFSASHSRLAKELTQRSAGILPAMSAAWREQPGGRNKERGQAHLPNPEVISTVVKISLNAFPTGINENRR
jgi:hypothetical protein